LRLHDFSFLTDENIHPAVVADLRAGGCDVLDVCEEGWRGEEDAALLRLACSLNRIVVTHDSDFGGLSIARFEPVVGIVFLRPGHIDPKFTIDTLHVLFEQDIEVSPPFLIVAKRIRGDVTIRLRRL
jgi:predicted nuclease of predicted toxin-antitoxin system